MNKNRFRRVFSKRLGMLVAVAENVTSQGKAAGESSGISASGRALGVISSMTAFALALVALQPSVSRAQSLPTNGQVVAGQASISQTNPNTMTINQGTQRTVINWNSFDVGQGNTVQFNQPNAQAQALNRVTGSMPSNIQGSLLANGQVLIQNANGVLFSKSAVVNVGSLLATTKSIDSNAFMAGNPLALQSTGTNASVVNDGTINAQGYVVMMGDQVRNSGTITTAQGGQVALAAGDAATVALPNGQGIQLTLTNASANALVENSGTIKADNGAVLLTARGSNTLLNTVVNLSGVVRAGTVVADAGNTGDVAVTGKIDASNAAGQGGTVVLSGDRVGVFGNASIDASGATQGGKVIIGGDSLHKLAGTQAQGMLQDGVQFANYTQVDAGASVNAGSAHGNGGFVETSGHSLDVQGQVGAAAPEGKAGEWLIDPTDVTISTGADANYNGNVSGGTFSGGTNTTATVKNTTISNALNTGTGVTITTASSGTATGNIVQQAGADIVKNAGAATSLTMAANGSITLNGNITSTANALNLNLTSGMGTGKGSVNQTSSSTIDLNGGSLTVSADTTAGSGAAGSSNAIEFRGTDLNIGGGTITGVSNTGSGVVFVGNFTEIGSGTLTVNGTTNTGDGIQLWAGVVAVTQGANVNLNGSSTTGRGVYQNNNHTVLVTDNAAVNISGTSANSHGVDLEANVTVNRSAHLNVNGTSNGAGLGVVRGSSGALTIADNAAVSLVGTSVNGSGVGFWSGTTASDNATLTVAGTSTNGGGVQINNGNTTITGTQNAHVTVNGTSVSNDGIVFWTGGNNGVTAKDQSVVAFTGQSSTGNGLRMGDPHFSSSTNMTVSDNASLSLSGVSDTGRGVYVGALNLTTSQNGVANIKGKSRSDFGVDIGFTSATEFKDSGGGWGSRYSHLTASDNSVINIDGQSTNNVGTVLAGYFNIAGHGALNVNGTGATAGAQLYGPVNAADNSTINVTGQGGSAFGVWVSGINATDHARVNAYGSSTDGDGLVTFENNSVSGNGSLNLSGQSANADGTRLDSPVNATDNGTVNISGTATGNGTGFVETQSGSVNVSGNGSANITGQSADGTGAEFDGNVTVTNNGTVNISGNSTDGTGVLVNPTGSINTSGNGSTNISGDSTNGTGTDINGSINTTDNGTINISGNSTDGTGVIVDPNGSINISGNGSGEISGNSTNGNGTIIDGDVNTTDNGTIVIIDNGTVLKPGDNGGSNGGDTPIDNGGNTPPDNGDNGGNPDNTPSVGGSGGGSGGIAAGLVGAIGVGGAAAYFMGDMMSAHWYLEAGQALLLESGDSIFWADAELEHVTVDMTTNSADVQLLTHAGALDRHLAYRDGAEGVKHFTYEDPKQKTKADLSVNMQTHEYFYTESGVKDGKAYVVKSHGWLKVGLAPVGGPARATMSGAA